MRCFKWSSFVKLDNLSASAIWGRKKRGLKIVNLQYALQPPVCTLESQLFHHLNIKRHHLVAGVIFNLAQKPPEELPVNSSLRARSIQPNGKLSSPKKQRGNEKFEQNQTLDKNLI